LIGGIQVQGKSKPVLVNSSPTDSIERFSFHQPFGVSASAFVFRPTPTSVFHFFTILRLYQSPFTHHHSPLFKFFYRSTSELGFSMNFMLNNFGL